MAIKLQYPIMTTHNNIVICHDKSVIAYYRIPNTPITITDDAKKEKHKQTVAQTINKLAKNKTFDISLIPKDYLLEEKMNDFSKALAPNNRILGETLLAYSVDKLTQEMEIPYQFDWVIGVTLRKQDKSGSISDLAYERFSELSGGYGKHTGHIAPAVCSQSHCGGTGEKSARRRKVRFREAD